MTARHDSRLRSLRVVGAVPSILGEFGRDAYPGSAAGRCQNGLGTKRPTRAGNDRPLPA